MKTRIFVDFAAVSRGLELCLAQCLLQELKEGMLSQGGVKMIRDVMNEDAGYYKSLLESLRMDMIFTSNE